MTDEKYTKIIEKLTDLVDEKEYVISTLGEEISRLREKIESIEREREEK